METSSNNNSRDENPAAVFSPKEKLAIDTPIGTKQHADGDWHLIGESLPEAERVSSLTGLASVGNSPIPAREDHLHAYADGTAAAPSIGWGSLGFYKVSASVLGLAIAGVNKFNWDSNRFYAPSSMSIGAWSTDGSYGAVEGLYGYLLMGSTINTNVYLRASGQISLGATGYVDRVIINGTTVTITPTISCNTINSGAVNCGAVNCGNISSGQVNTNNNWVVAYGMYRTSGNLSLDSPGGYTTFANWITNGGKSGFAASYYTAIWDNATDGRLGYFTSRRELKEDIKSFTESGSIIDGLNPVTFVERSKDPDNEDPMLTKWRKANWVHGFIAEEVAEVAPHVATWEFREIKEVRARVLQSVSVDEKTGEEIIQLIDAPETVVIGREQELTPMAWDQFAMLSVVVAELKNLRKRVKELESRLS